MRVFVVVLSLLFLIQCDGYLFLLSSGRTVPASSLLSRSIHNGVLQLDSPKSKMQPRYGIFRFSCMSIIFCFGIHSWSRILSSTKNLQIGESFIGQVEDVIGSNKDPIVLFSVSFTARLVLCLSLKKLRYIDQSRR